eukprot:TRINITY_DN105436_c0_g1_i1.p1 TRINITY_DN105436_c0_g1~~TRINITY_DN105436_c0_g1_i1.p1  ORF type:complete len:357 (+),score=34.33 TRINITY_DN105436_c0_g1_i1:134-1072(+)
MDQKHKYKVAKDSVSAAVCIQGQVRSFTMPEVHLSIRDFVVKGMNASFLRLFFVLNVTSDTCSHCPPSIQRSRMSDLMPAFEALGQHLIGSIHFEPDCCWPELRTNLSYSQCQDNNRNGPVQWRGKEICARSIASYELEQGKSFDWVLWVRPDLKWSFPIGDIRSFEYGSLYSCHMLGMDLSDHIGLMSADVWNVYVRSYRHMDGEKYTCLTHDDVLLAWNGTLCNYNGLPGCYRCYYGNAGCLPKMQLVAKGKGIKQLPPSIVRRIRLPRPNDPTLYDDAYFQSMHTLVPDEMQVFTHPNATAFRTETAFF